ncbi:MAG: alkaline phosphatase family protein [Crocinitomicaceae bacterium]|nr:alkaline phosphatase family protein [Crocinitomicaceae bacterium]
MIKLNQFLFALFILGTLSSNAQQKDSPKLIVGIVVDQMCYDYLYRFYDKYSNDGFKKLMTKGANCRNMNYNYVPTYTGPGHASIYTGTTPSNHGIVANEWFDREQMRTINCVEDSAYSTVGSDSKAGSCSPINLKSNTITDQLKLTYPSAKVISMSIKNRGAILPGGHLSDGSYWYDYSNGNFITSTFFKSSMPQWVTDFNNKKYAELYMSGQWNTLYDISTYTESGADDSPYEYRMPGSVTPTFPYDLKLMSSQEGCSATGLMPYTPYGNTILTDLAISAITAENLGQDDQTDMLLISYSTPDIVGHTFGPYSKEIEDIYLRLDLEVAKLMKTVEKLVGKKDYTIFITADHAVVPTPQNLVDHNLPGGYVYMDTNMYYLKEALTAKFGQSLLLDQDNLNFYLDHDSIALLGLKLGDVVEVVVDVTSKWDGIKRVFTAEQLYNGNSNDPWLNMVRNGYHHGESGDVIIILEPGYLTSHKEENNSGKGTSHGSAYSYDTHVPLLWYGAGIPKMELFRHLEITDITSTLTHMLYLQQVNATTGKPIVELFED